MGEGRGASHPAKFCLRLCVAGVQEGGGGSSAPRVGTQGLGVGGAG